MSWPGASSDLATSTDVIRRATISPDGALGRRVPRRPTDPGGPRDLASAARSAGSRHERILPPIDPDARFGRTWSTEFTWADDGSLAVQSCGEVSCRTRVLDATWRPAVTLADPELGATIGVAGGRLVSYLACRGLPCPIVATDLASGRRRTLVAAAGSAIVTSTPAGGRLVHTRGRRSSGRRCGPWPSTDRAGWTSGPSRPASTCRRRRIAPRPASPCRPVGSSSHPTAGCRSIGSGPLPRSARSSMDVPPPSGRCSHDHSVDPPPARRPVTRRAGRRAAGRFDRPQPGSGPERQSVRPGPGPRVLVAAWLRAGRLDRDRDPGRRGRRDGHPRQSRRDLRVRRRRPRTSSATASGRPVA